MIPYAHAIALAVWTVAWKAGFRSDRAVGVAIACVCVCAFIAERSRQKQRRKG